MSETLAAVANKDAAHTKKLAVLCPALRSAYGVGPDTAAQLLVTAGDNPQRLQGEGSFAALCGAALDGV
nr:MULTISPECIES: transposase [Nocardia]